MKRVIYALFDNAQEAERALEDINEAGIPREKCSVVFHRDTMSQHDESLTESDAGRGLLRGLLAGAIGGGLLGGLILGPFGIVGLGPVAAAIAMGGAGSLFGALGGALSGAAMTDEKLKELATWIEEGKILVTADVEGVENQAQVTEIFENHGASIRRKSVFPEVERVMYQ